MQIIGYETGANDPDADPALLVASDGTVNTLTLTPESSLSYQLQSRHCAGRLTESGRHKSCPNDDAPYCYAHDDMWQCALCTGDCNKPLESCHEEHAIYLAAFAPDTFKVGVTRSWRLKTRLTEQGADKAAHIQTVSDGRIARQRENEIAETLTDRVRVPTKIKSLHKSVDETAWNNLLDEYDPLDTFTFDYGFTIDQQPLEETLLSGTVYGTQGRVLLLENSGSIYAVNMRDLVGYDITEDADSQELQSSFASFE